MLMFRWVISSRVWAGVMPSGALHLGAWMSDPERCRAARIPEEREFATKGDLAKAMVRHALASPLPVAWVTADSAYGQEWRLRRMLGGGGGGVVLALAQTPRLPPPGR